MTTMVDEPKQGFRPELAAMVAVISITSWHVGNYMSSVDGWFMASIMGAVLGYCNFLMAHNIFKSYSTSRVPAFVGLLFFALTSTWMQYTYFNNSPHMTVTMMLGVNVDALFMGIWAPAAEVLLGWLHAANSKVSKSVASVSSLHHSVATIAPVNRPIQPVTTQPFHHEAATTRPFTEVYAENGLVTEPASSAATFLSQPKQTSHQEMRQQKIAVRTVDERINPESTKLVKEARLAWLRERLQTIKADKAIPADEWAEELHVSRQTVYRDIEEIKKAQKGLDSN